MQVALGGGDTSVAGDLAQAVQWDAGVGHPGQPGVPEAVALQLLVAQLGHHFVP